MISRKKDVKQQPKQSAVLQTITYSGELAWEGKGKAIPAPNTADDIEIDLVKAILNRESYLSRLKDIVITTSKKFKPETADVLDLVRAATLDVVDCIVKWRNAKEDHSVPYKWDGNNYLLRMSSDLDYMAEYRPIRQFMGFPLLRNPFCVVHPMEDGATIFSARLLDERQYGNNERIMGGLLIEDLRLHYRFSPEKKPNVDNHVTILPLTGFPLGGHTMAPIHHAAADAPAGYSTKKQVLFDDPGTDFLDFGGNSRARSPSSPTQNASDFSPQPQFDGPHARARSPGSPVQFQTTHSINNTIGSSSSPVLSRNEIMRPLSRDLSLMGGVGSMGKPDSRPGTSGSRRSDSEGNSGALPKMQGLGGVDSTGSSGFHSSQTPHANPGYPSSSSSSSRPKSPYYHGHTYEAMFDQKAPDIGKTPTLAGSMEAGIIVPKKTKKVKPVSVAAAKISANIVMSGDMNRIRQAELIILREEERHGKFTRDKTTDALIPVVTTKTRRQQAMEKAAAEAAAAAAAKIAMFAALALEGDPGAGTGYSPLPPHTPRSRQASLSPSRKNNVRGVKWSGKNRTSPTSSTRGTKTSPSPSPSGRESPGASARSMNIHDPDFFNSDAQDIYGLLTPGPMTLNDSRLSQGGKDRGGGGQRLQPIAGQGAELRGVQETKSSGTSKKEHAIRGKLEEIEMMRKALVAKKEALQDDLRPSSSSSSSKRSGSNNKGAATNTSQSKRPNTSERVGTRTGLQGTKGHPLHPLPPHNPLAEAARIEEEAQLLATVNSVLEGGRRRGKQQQPTSDPFEVWSGGEADASGRWSEPSERNQFSKSVTNTSLRSLSPTMFSSRSPSPSLSGGGSRRQSRAGSSRGEARGGSRSSSRGEARGGSVSGSGRGSRTSPSSVSPGGTSRRGTDRTAQSPRPTSALGRTLAELRQKSTAGTQRAISDDDEDDHEEPPVVVFAAGILTDEQQRQQQLGQGGRVSRGNASRQSADAGLGPDQELWSSKLVDPTRRSSKGLGYSPAVYIRSAIKIQALIRGFVMRQWLKYVKLAQIPSAQQIQRTIRGWLGRIKVAVLRHRMYSARNIQRMFRGHLARQRATTEWIQAHQGIKAIEIQRIWRGKMGKKRVQQKRDLEEVVGVPIRAVDPRNLYVSDIKELGQRIQRAVAKEGRHSRASPAATSFGPNLQKKAPPAGLKATRNEPVGLLASGLVAHALHKHSGPTPGGSNTSVVSNMSFGSAVSSSSHQYGGDNSRGHDAVDYASYPPDEVLHLLRMVVMLIQNFDSGPFDASEAKASAAPPVSSSSDAQDKDGDKNEGVFPAFATATTTKGGRVKQYEGIDGENMLWTEAYQILNRAERFVRLIFAVAQGPASKPPRLVHIPPAVILVYQAQLHNPRWSAETFRQIGRGARLCNQLFLFVTGLVDISARQQPFLGFLPASCPTWLPRIFELQSLVRAREFRLTSINRALLGVTDYLEKWCEDKVLRRLLTVQVSKLKLEVTTERNAVQTLIDEEKQIKQQEAGTDDECMSAMEAKLRHMNGDMSADGEHYKRLLRSQATAPVGFDVTKLGLQIAETRHRIIVRELEKKDYSRRTEAARAQVELNAKYRKGTFRLPADAQLTVTNAGEAQSLLIISSAKREVLLYTAKVSSPADLPPASAEAYAKLLATEDYAAAQVARLHAEAEVMRDHYERQRQEVQRNVEAVDMKIKGLMIPTDRERYEEQAEDDREAKRGEVLVRLKRFVPDQLLVVPPLKHRLNPVIIALARDIPAYAKRKLHEELTRLLPGVFITLDFTHGHGVDTAAMQSVLDAHRSVVMSVEPGLTSDSRSSFLKKLEVSVKSLFPVPNVVLVLASEDNRMGSEGNHTFGVHSYDLQAMADGDIKIALEGMAHAVHQIKSRPEIQDQMMTVSHRAFPPNPDMSMVLEAMYILQTEDEDFIHGPKTEDDDDDENTEWGNGPGRRSPPPSDLLSHGGGYKPSVSFGNLPSSNGSSHTNPPYNSHTSSQAVQLAVGRQPANLPPLAAATKPIGWKGVSWKLTAALLADPLDLITRLTRCRRGLASTKRMHAIRLYVNHQQWPKEGSAPRGASATLHLIASFIEHWINAEEKTMARGGAPFKPLTKSSLTFLQSVVIIGDSPDLDPENMEITEVKGVLDFGWKMPAVRLVRATLQDMRVLKTVFKIAKGDEMYSVTVYRDKGMVYFDAYDPQTSRVYLTSVKVSDIPTLLTPIAQAKTLSEFAQPPQSDHEVYERLVRLLRFSGTSNRFDAGRMLTCHREYTFLESLTCTLSGHKVQLKCYEAALGELFISVFVFEFSASITVMLDEVTRLELLNHCDPVLEKKYVQEGDAHKMQQLVRDRLQLWPRLSAVQTGQFDPHALLIGRPNPLSSKVDISTVQKTQGFRLRILTTGGPGRVLARWTKQFSGIVHVVTLKTLSSSKTLRVCCYEPRTRHTMEIRIDLFLRKVLLGTENDDAKGWGHKLLKRLRVSWRGDPPTMVLDTTICRVIKRVDGRRLCLAFKAVDADRATLTITDEAIAAVFEASISLHDMVSLMAYQLPLEAYQEHFGKQEHIDAHVKTIVQDMVRTEVGEGEVGVPVPEASTTLAHLGAKAKAALANLPYAPLLDTHSNTIINREGSVAGGSVLDATIDSAEINSLAAAPLPVSVLSESNMRDFVTNQSKMRMLLDRLSVVLKRVEGDSLHSGYACYIEKSLLVPTAIRIHLTPQLKPHDNLPFDSSLKHFPTLHNFERRPASEKPVPPPPAESEVAMVVVPPSSSQSQRHPPLSRQPSQFALDKHDAATVATATTMATRITDTSPLMPPTLSPREKVIRPPRLRRAHQRICYVSGVDYERRQPPMVDVEAELNVIIFAAAKKKLEEYERKRAIARKAGTVAAMELTEDELSGITELPAYIMELNKEKDLKERNVRVDPSGPVEEMAAGRAEILTRAEIRALEQQPQHRNKHLGGEEDGEDDTLSASGFGGDLVSMAPSEFTSAEWQLGSVGYPTKEGVETPKEIGRKEKMLFEFGCKTTFRDRQGNWLAHVACKVYQITTFDSTKGYMNKKLRFVVYDARSSRCFEGVIVNLLHLRKVLGRKGRDLLPKERKREMLLYLVRNRMLLTRNEDADYDGFSSSTRIEIEEESVTGPWVPPPPRENPWIHEDALAGTSNEYRMEFITDRIYDLDKVTPVNLGGNRDDASNEEKLFHVEARRGIKILRLARRVSGILITFIVFEMIDDISDPRYRRMLNQKDYRARMEQEAEAELLQAENHALMLSQIEEENSLISLKSSEGHSKGSGGGGGGGMLGKKKKATGDWSGKKATIASQGHGSSSRDAQSKKQTEMLSPEALEMEGWQDTLRLYEFDLPDIKVYEKPPNLRIIAYDPRTQAKQSVAVPPGAIMELAGGKHSQYLAPTRRREMTKALIETLMLVFPKWGGYKVLVPWSGADKDDMASAIASNTKTITAKGERPKLKARTGKLFRSGMRLCSTELVVTLYSSDVKDVKSLEEEEEEENREKTDHADGTVAIGEENPDSGLAVTLYRGMASQNVEILITRKQQLERIGCTITSVPDGAARAAAIRELCSYFDVKLVSWEEEIPDSPRTMAIKQFKKQEKARRLLENKGSEDSPDISRPASASGQGLGQGLGPDATVPPPSTLVPLKKQISGTMDFSNKSDRPQELDAILESIDEDEPPKTRMREKLTVELKPPGPKKFATAADDDSLASTNTGGGGNADTSADGAEGAMLTDDPFIEPLSGYHNEPMVLARGVSLPVSKAGSINAAIAAALHTQERRQYVIGIYEKTGPPLKAGAMMLNTTMGGIAVRICEQTAVGNMDKSNSAVLHLNPSDLFKLCKAQNRSELVGDMRDLRRKADDLPANATEADKDKIMQKMHQLNAAVVDCVNAELAACLAPGDKGALTCYAVLTGAASRTTPLRGSRASINKGPTPRGSLNATPRSRYSFD